MDSKQNLETQIDKIETEITETRELLKDPSYAPLAEVEISRLEEEKAALEKSLEALEVPTPFVKHPDPENVKNNHPSPQHLASSQIILEIRPAAGGNEAGLFARQLLRMYKKFAQSKGFKVETLTVTEGGLGNLKEATLQISAPRKGPKELDSLYGSLYETFRREAGVHRVQRVPATEKSGRIHTSTVTVAVLPVVSEIEVKIDPKDLRIETFRSSGPGGQHMQKTESAVRLTHLPTGITASSQQARHQQANKDRALTILRSRLYSEMQTQQKESLAEVRAEAVGRGQRAEKIRTYNFPQNRVTDHRLKRSWHNLEAILDGDLKEILQALANN